MNPTISKTDRIRELNDAFRRSFAGGQVMLTSGIDALPDEMTMKAIKAVQDFNSFDRDNDAHQEHDFGSLTLDDVRVFFKIDYYDRQMQHHSDNPADPTCTRRVLTIMLAEEY